MILSPSARLLLVVADPLLRASLAGSLGADLAVTAVADVATGLACLDGQDLAVIDSGACDDEGLAPLRRAAPSLPLILLAAAAGAEAGADAVVAKPVRVGVLAARIAALLARRPAMTSRIGRWRFDSGRRLLLDGEGGTVRLTDKEAAILSRLAQAEGRVVARESLLADIWGYGAGIDTHTLETHVYRLRRKLGSGADDLLCTEAGGYRLATASLPSVP